MFAGFSPESIDFLWGIRMNNNRDWFLEHKKQYTDFLYEPMKALGKALFATFADQPGNISDVTIKQVDITQIPQRYYQTLNETAEEERGKAVFDATGVTNLTLENVSLHVPEELKNEWPNLARFDDCTDLVKRNCNF